MIRPDFDDWVASMRVSYEMRMPHDEILDAWFAELRRFEQQRNVEITVPAMYAIKQQIIRDNPQRFPMQFCDKVKSAFWSWVREQGDFTEKKCPHCDSGWVSVMEWDEFYKAPKPTAYACRVCRAGVAEKHKLKMLTLNQAKSEGREVIDGRKPFAYQEVA